MTAGRGVTDILVIGTGAVGEWVVEFLARTPEVSSVAAADANLRRVEAITLRASVGALHEGYRPPRISSHELDLSNVDATASLIEELRPKVILHVATLLSVPTMIRRLSPNLFGRLREVGFGAFLPLHLFLTYQLMRAVREVGDPPDVIDAPFPDFVNAALGAVGLAPLAGCGNVELLAGLAQFLVARERGVSPQDVRLYLVASHSVNECFARDGSPGKAPYYFRIYVSGTDVTEEVQFEKLLAAASRQLQGEPTEARTAATAVKAVMSILREDRIHMHAPGPNGLPGGYPVRLYPGGADVLLPPGLTLDEAVRINWAGLQVGGIERIDDDGTVHCTEQAVLCMREELGSDARSFQLEEAGERAQELLERFRERFVNP